MRFGGLGGLGGVWGAGYAVPGGQKLFQSINQIGPAKEKKNLDGKELIRFLITIRKMEITE